MSPTNQQPIKPKPALIYKQQKYTHNYSISNRRNIKSNRRKAPNKHHIKRRKRCI